MLHQENISLPRHYQQIAAESEHLKFTMLSDIKTGSLLRTLAAAKQDGHFLELGTGTGLSLTWLAAGATLKSSILSIDNEDTYQQVARKAFEKDTRITFSCTDANQWLDTYQGPPFDLIFADAWPGKFEHTEKALKLVKMGGFYVIDDLLPHPAWPEAHLLKVEALINLLIHHKDFVYTPLNWSSGLMVLVRIA